MLKTIPFTNFTDEEIFEKYEKFYKNDNRFKKYTEEDILMYLKDSLNAVVIKEGIIFDKSLNFHHKVNLKFKEDNQKLKDDNFEINPLIDSEPYFGICDSFEDVLRIYDFNKLKDNYTIVVSPIEKKVQPSKEGWRWSKWGKYIGNQTPLAEYLYDEPVIEGVFIFQTYKFK